MQANQILEMKGNQFPFGQILHKQPETKKILIKKRYQYKNQNEYLKLKEKIEKLKNISHKNTINLRSAEDNNNGFIDLFYPYVPIPLEESFNQNSNQTVKQMHKQFIELAIYLAKNYILTSFNPNRCGVIINEDKTLVKYYLPLNQIIITSEIAMLERSVQLFNVQSMHFLDTLCQQSALNTTIQNSSQRTFKNRMKLFPNGMNLKKNRKQSQPVSFLSSHLRKLSNIPTSQSQLRKLSHLSRQLSEISQMYKQRRKESTRMGSFSTLKHRLTQSQKSSEKNLLQNYKSETEIIKQKVLKLRERSSLAIRRFRLALKDLKGLRNLSLKIQKLRS